MHLIIYFIQSEKCKSMFRTNIITVNLYLQYQQCVIIIITKCIKLGPHGIPFALADLQFGEHTHMQINIVVTHCCSK